MLSPRLRRPAPIAVLAVLGTLSLGCGSSDSQDASQQAADAGAMDVADAYQEHAPVDAPPASEASTDASGTPSDASEASTDAPGDVVGADAPVDTGPDTGDGGYPEPLPTEIEFQALAPLPQGAQIVFNDWGADPNELISMKPDGTGATKIFRVNRIWSFGISHSADKIAFSCHDPDQEAHYGLTLGDAIEHTWLYDVATQTVELQAFGNINDECHTFGPDDSRLYVCRRYDFAPDWSYKGWRIGRIDLATKQFEFLTPDLPKTFDLDPQPLPDGSSMLFGRIVWEPPDPQQNSVQQMALPNGAATQVRSDGGRPVLSPDGTRYVFRKSTDGFSLYSSKLDGTDEIKVSSAAATDPVWSPDGSQLAYLVGDSSLPCSHIDVVATDGSQVDAPVRLRDCSVTGENISGLAWVDRP